MGMVAGERDLSRRKSTVAQMKSSKKSTFRTFRYFCRFLFFMEKNICSSRSDFPLSVSVPSVNIKLTLRPTGQMVFLCLRCVEKYGSERKKMEEAAPFSIHKPSYFFLLYSMKNEPTFTFTAARCFHQSTDALHRGAVRR